MKFQKGVPRHPDAGRKAGTVNKKPFDLLDILRKAACNPFEFMASVVQDNVLDLDGKPVEVNIDQRINCAKELGKYLLPQKRSIDVTGTIILEKTPAEELARATIINPAGEQQVIEHRAN